VKERGILFSGPMVRAILTGVKTQTRRIVKPQPHPRHYLQPMWGTSPDGHEFGEKDVWCEVGPDYPDGDDDERRCPHGAPGDRLWVKETWAVIHDYHQDIGEAEAMRDARERMPWAGIAYRAAANGGHAESHRVGDRWRPSIYMPRWASRIALEVTSVRVERLQDLGEEDAIAEGITMVPFYPDSGFPLSKGFMLGEDDGKAPLDPSAQKVFERLWDSINAKRAPWASNPWVWVIEFKRIEQGERAV
jgi:hypothetical protein